MRQRLIAAASAAALALGVGVATASTALGATSHTLTVWLQVDAQNGWPQLVTAANNQFESQNPGWTVNIDYQQWSTHLGNFNATIAGGNEPDVIEMGNTETTSYMASGAFAPLNASQFPNSSHWLGGLKASGTYMGKLYAVPYYAGSRVVTYRADLFKKAGIKKAPTSLAQMQADLVKVGKKEKKVKGFSPLYVGGEDWYTALSFVFDHHGSIAKYEHGKWVGTLDSKNSIAGLTAYLNFFNATEPKSTAKLDGTSPYAYTVYSEGKTAAMYGPAWFKGSVTNKKYLADTKQMVMPSYVKGQPMPGFLGGSDLAIPAKSSNQSQAAQWIADYTSTTSEQGLQTAGNIPNATNLLTKGDVNDEAAAQSWFVPQAVNWVEVENANILKTLLGDMLTGQLSVKQAATTASENIAQTLNQPAS